MTSFLRDTALGQIIRLATRNKVLLYPEEQPDFQCPAAYAGSDKVSSGQDTSARSSLAEDATAPVRALSESERLHSLQRKPTERDDDLARQTSRAGLGRIGSHARVDLSKVTSEKDLERAYSEAAMERGPSRAIVPEKLEDGTILVDWYETDDPANPQNWSLGRKTFVTFQIW